MKYFATVDGVTYEIAVEPHGQITVDGVELSADMRAVGGEVHSLLLANTSHEILIDSNGERSERSDHYSVIVEGQRYVVKVQDERSRRLAQADRSVRVPEGELSLKAPIPGLVVRIMVEAGKPVVEGEALLILEAMKMENELRAPRDGVIHEVRTAPGMQVASGQILLTLK